MGKELKRKSFVFNVAWQEVLMEYPPEVRLEVYDAIIRYVASGTLSELKPLAKMAFSFIKNEIDYNNDRYEETVAKRSAAGRKGMAARYSAGDAGTTGATNGNKTNKCYTCYQGATGITNVTNLTDNVNDNDIKENSSSTNKRKNVATAGDTARKDGETSPLQAYQQPAAQEEKSCAKKEEAAITAATGCGTLDTEQIIAQIDGRDLLAEQMAMLHGLQPAQWLAVKAEIFAQWRFEGYRNTLHDALRHFCNLVRVKAAALRGNGRQPAQPQDFDAMLAAGLAMARTPGQQLADDEQFKRDFDL